MSSHAPPDLGLPVHHPLSAFISEACGHRLFAALWLGEGNAQFRGYAVAAMELACIKGLLAESRSQLYERIATAPRAHVVSDIIGKRLMPGTVKLLEKSDYRKTKRADLLRFIEAVDALPTRRALSHLSHISPVLMRQLSDIPAALRVSSIFLMLNRLAVTKSRWQQIDAAVSDLPLEMRASLLAKAKRVRSIGDFWDFCFECTDGMWRPFTLPEAFFTSPRLQPLTSAQEMEREGLRMRNCLAQRVGQVMAGHEAYFRWLGNPPCTVQGIRRGQAWQLGRILGEANTSLDADDSAEIRRCATEILASVPSLPEIDSASRADAMVEQIAGLGRMPQLAEGYDRVKQHLAGIRGRTIRMVAGETAYAVFKTKAGYIQWMSNVEGDEFLAEIQSHKYRPEMETRLTDAVVTLISGSGFRWPTGQQNFVRRFPVGSDVDVERLAAFSVGILHRVFGHRVNNPIVAVDHIPDGI